LQATIEDAIDVASNESSSTDGLGGQEDTRVLSFEYGRQSVQSIISKCATRNTRHDLDWGSSEGSLAGASRDYTQTPSSSPTSINPGQQRDLDTNSEDDTDVDDVASELFHLLSSRFDSCTEEEHSQALLFHQTKEGSNHHDLSVTYNCLPLAGQRHAEIGLASRHFPGSQGMPRRLYSTREDLGEIFHGIASPEEPRRNVCLHEEVSAPSQPLVSFDIDSLLGFPRSLAAFRQGFRYTPVKQLAFNIKADLHVQRTISYITADGRPHRVSHNLRDIPHLYFGLVEGLYHCPVYIFFPSLMDPSRPFTYITDQQMTRFIDNAMWPACKDHLEADVQQHMPPSHGVAELKARARAKEQRVRNDENSPVQNSTFLLRPEKLDPIWQALQSRIADETLGLGDFKDAFLFIDAKGLKVDFKERFSLYQALECFEDNINKVFDLDYFGEDNFILDIGKEVCPQARAQLGNNTEEYYEPQTYLYKRCCLQYQYDTLAKKLFDGKKGKAEFFNIGFLNDAACFTLSPPKISKAFRGGLYFCQWYSSIKEVLDASGCYPFQNKDLLEIAIDSKVWKANAASAKVSHAKSRDSLIRSYCFSKERIYKALRDSQGTPYGSRIEFRVAWRLFQAIKNCARPHSDIVKHAIRLDNCPTYVWSVSTQKFANFMIGNYEKITSAIEIASLTSPLSGVSLERTRVMIVLLKCLRSFANGSLPRDQTLWFDTRETANGTRRGLGFETTVSAFGYGWFNPIIDWESFRFLPSISTEIVASKDHFLSWYHNSRHLIQDSAEILDDSIELLATYRTCMSAQKEIMKLMTHICFRQFRRDVVSSLSKELRSHQQASLDADSVVFCFEGIKEAFASTPNLVAGNKTTIKTPDMMMECLWGSRSEYNRKHFSDKPFRMMRDKADCILAQYPGLHSLWQSHFTDEFLQYHWILPLPDANGTLISTAKCTFARNWWSLNQRPSSSSWVWARREYRPGYPEPFPASLTMTSEAFRAHLETLVRRADHASTHIQT
jgi:hypothetical protein